MSYSHSSVLVNGRNVTISAILSGSAELQSVFEGETVDFIKHWLGDVQTFTLTTSGSTGTPKEIALTRSQLIHSAQRTIKALSLSADDTALICLDTKYIAGKMMLVRALEANMKIVAAEPSSNPIKNLSVQPDFAAFVPLQLDEIFKDESSVRKLNQFNSIIVGGTSVSTTLLEKIKTLSCAVYATYGMTETVSHIALQKLNGADAQDHFETLPGIKIRTDERDCLVLSLPDFREPVITNDIVKIIDHSGFKILGRYDNVINSGGVKLMPETIEKKLSPLLTNQDFFVAGIPDDRLGQKLVLIIEGKQQELPARLKLALATYEIPKEIFYLDEFVRTETQKINRLQTLEKALKSH
jgi:O-succinylbenzoic acid--CoA ligase